MTKKSSERSPDVTVRCAACDNTIQKTLDSLYQARFIDRSPDSPYPAELHLCTKCADGLARTLQDEVLQA